MSNRILRIAFVVSTTFVLFFSFTAFAAITRDQPTSTERFTNQDGEPVTVNTYADGAKTYYNGTTGVFAGDTDGQTLTPDSSSNASAAAGAGAAPADGAGQPASTAPAAGANGAVDTEFGDLDWAIARNAADDAARAAAAGGSSSTTIKVTEYIPGVTGTEWCKQGTGKFKDQTCSVTIQGGFSTVQSMISGFVKYVTFLAVLGTVLMLVISGIQYSLAGVTDGKADAKEKIAKTLKAFAVLFLVGFILNTVAPWVYR